MKLFNRRGGRCRVGEKKLYLSSNVCMGGMKVEKLEKNYDTQEGHCRAT
jgi:hypothetical protein